MGVVFNTGLNNFARKVLIKGIYAGEEIEQYEQCLAQHFYSRVLPKTNRSTSPRLSLEQLKYCLTKKYKNLVSGRNKMSDWRYYINDLGHKTEVYDTKSALSNCWRKCRIGGSNQCAGVLKKAGGGRGVGVFVMDTDLLTTNDR